MVKKSSFYKEISDRYDKFSYDNLTKLTYTDAIINFNSKRINSKIKSDYLLFEEEDEGYNHLGIATDTLTKNRYIETFFYQNTDMYIKGQTVVKVNSFTLYSSDGKIIVTDNF